MGIFIWLARFFCEWTSLGIGHFFECYDDWQIFLVGHILMWDIFFWCRTLRVGVVFNCWSKVGMFCHWTSEKLSMLPISGLWNYNTTKYMGLQLIMALSEWFWDTTCTFHFPAISEVMLTPYDFSVIIGLKLGGERVEGHDTCGTQMIYGPDPSIRGNPKAQAEEGWGPNSIG